MIISHKHRFIFVKTAKTAGTSLEVFLAKHCGEDDIITPTFPLVDGHRPRNYRKSFWPFPELFSFNYPRDKSLFCERRFFTPVQTFRDCVKRWRYHEHIPARVLKMRVDPEVWDSYHKFTIERDPWDKTISHYHMQRSYREGELSFDEYLDEGVFAVNYPFYTDRDGAMLVDQVIRYEHLAEELGELCKRWGIPYEGSLGVRAKGGYRTDHRPYTEVYTPEQAERVGKIFERETALHGYRFGATVETEGTATP